MGERRWGGRYGRIGCEEREEEDGRGRRKDGKEERNRRGDR